MKFKIQNTAGINILEPSEQCIGIITSEDSADVVSECFSQNVTRVILRVEDFDLAFFDLSTKLLGDFLQRFSTYGIKLAIMGDLSGFPSKSLSDFIRESNKTGNPFFVGSMEEARQVLTR